MACSASRSSCSKIRMSLASTSLATGSWADARNSVFSLRQMLMVLLPVFFQQLVGASLRNAVRNSVLLVFITQGFRQGDGGADQKQGADRHVAFYHEIDRRKHHTRGGGKQCNRE